MPWFYCSFFGCGWGSAGGRTGNAGDTGDTAAGTATESEMSTEAAEEATPEPTPPPTPAPTDWPTCWDGIRNQGEANVDCGGPCNSCSIEASDNPNTAINDVLAKADQVYHKIKTPVFTGYDGEGLRGSLDSDYTAKKQSAESKYKTVSNLACDPSPCKYDQALADLMNMDRPGWFKAEASPTGPDTSTFFPPNTLFNTQTQEKNTALQSQQDIRDSMINTKNSWNTFYTDVTESARACSQLF